jgi:hypothetical protein
MLRHIKLQYLLVGLVIGIVGIYFIKPSEKIVYKYPNPENAGKITYKDKNGVCYKYNVKEVDCDKNVARMKDYPLNN